jgi:aminoglycoside/choline kinase family phosphotransferase
MIGKDNITRLLDYQGARIGPPAYDVASILWDTYYRLDADLREQLLRHYITRMAGRAQWFNEQVFRESLLPCRLQRHMQALGAYGFLSKGRTSTLYSGGLRLLREDLSKQKMNIRIGSWLSLPISKY